MALTVQSICNDAAIDCRQVLAPATSTADLQLMTGWVDRVHKDCLHSSVYSYLAISASLFTVTSAAGCYGLTSSVRRILGVFDYTTSRILFPIERATPPVTQMEKIEPAPGQASSPATQVGNPAILPISLQSSQPCYYRHFPPGANQPTFTNGSICFYPGAPAGQTRQIGVVYESQVATLVNATDVLLIPDDGRDMVVAGVNYLVNLFLKRIDEAQVWAQIYSALKKGESLV